MTDAVLGIDVSKNTFDTNLGAGTKVRSKNFANSPAGWHQLIAWLGEHKIGQVHACLESTGRHGLGIAISANTLNCSSRAPGPRLHQQCGVCANFRQSGLARSPA
jgi:hypothetical protein